jgi:hypothetical protein
MTELGRPYNPRDREGERSITMVSAKDLAPFADRSGGVQLDDREGGLGALLPV